MRLLIVAALCLSSISARAEDDVLRAEQARAAQLITLAKLAPLLCPWIEVDDDAVHALLAHADLTERQLMDPSDFGVQDELIARTFAQAKQRDGDQACVDVYSPLGENGVGLLRRKMHQPG